MKRSNVIAAALFAAAVWPLGPQAFARVDFNINIGPPPVIIAPMPPPPPPRHHRIFIEGRPRFVYSPDLGFSVSVGSPYDIVYYGDRYYVYDDGGWYWAPGYDGPWIFIEDYRLPGRIRRFRHEEIRRYGDEEFRRHGPPEGWREDGPGRWPDRGPDRGPDRWR
ncbi:MAG: hypothetical protein HGB04_02170 [Chlorobiaceae bacterium]|nr:hypothetical protein [Chlorobiaceae bacterium]